MIAILGVCLILCLALTPIAEASGEKYLFLGIGATHIEEGTDISRGDNLWTVRTDTDTGLLINFGGGYRVRENLRIEGEIAYRSSDVDNLELITMNQLHEIVVYERKGDFTSLSFMLNSWYDFDFGDKLKPYVGGGIGIAQISLKDIYISNYPPFFPWDQAIFNALYVNDEDWRFAYQGGIGIKYNLTNAFSVDVFYKYFATADPKFKSEYGDSITAKYRSSNILVSLQYLFGSQESTESYDFPSLTGFYCVANIGYANHDPDISTHSQYGYHSWYGSAPGQITAYSEDDTNTAYSFGIGYEFNKYMALECGYLDLGKTSCIESTWISNDTITLESEFETDGFYLGPQFSLPCTNKLKANARVGVYFWDSDIKEDGIFITPSYAFVMGDFSHFLGYSVYNDDRTDSGEDIYYGLGLSYLLTDNFGIKIGWTYYDIEINDVHIFDAGIVFRFGKLFK